MPNHLKGTGLCDAYARQNGNKIPCKVFVLENGSKRLIYRPVTVVDNFEDGNASSWSTQGTGSRSVTSGGLNGSNYKWEHNGFSEVHLAGSNAVDRGPQPGDHIRFWFRLNSTSGSTINRFEFSADTFNDSDCYRVEFERETGDNEFQIQKISGGSSVKNSTDPGHSVSIGQTYYCDILWNVGDTDITAQIFTPDGTADSSQVSISDDSSAVGSDYNQPGVFIRTNDNNHCYWDQIAIHN